MTKLWGKNYNINKVLEAFITGNDPISDLKIAHYDCIASIAHVKMLLAIKILSKSEATALIKNLNHLINNINKRNFSILKEQEDVHTAIENYLTDQLGDIGKKIHTARSRNDQVLTAIRLYCKDELKTILINLIKTLEVFYKFAVKYQYIPYVGRTHFQKAMPSSFGLWMGSFLESMLDNAKLIINSYNLIDQSPLGSAASYGVSLPIDRSLTSKLLGFNKVQNNVLYANNSRGKFESIIIHALSQVMLDLSKLATDIILFSIPEFAYLTLPVEFCSGSSLMPNKINPDPLELIRAKSAIVTTNLFQVIELSRGLPSGYNRDLQETKKPLFESFDIVKQSLEVITIIINKTEVNYSNCIAGFDSEVFATDYALKYSKEGVSFRDAYKYVSLNLDKVNFDNPIENIKSKTHIGATGNLGLKQIKLQINKLKHLKLLKGE